MATLAQFAAAIWADRVRETTTTTGTGTYTLAGAVSGHQSFSVIGNGNVTLYVVTDGVDWEVGRGTYSTTGPSLARTEVLASTNGDAAVNWSAGVKYIFIDVPAAVIDKILTVVGRTITGTSNEVSVANGDGESGNPTISLPSTLDLSGKTVHLPSNAVNAIGEIASGIRTGSDARVVTGTAGTNGHLGSWDANGDMVDSGIPASTVLVDGDIGSTVQAYDADLAAIAALSSANGDILYYNSGWNRLAKGSDDQVLTLASGIPSWQDAAGGGGLTWLGEQATTSGSSVGTTSIPAGTKEIYIRFTDVSLSSADDLLVQIGDSGGYETSGYNSDSNLNATKVDFTTGFGCNLSSGVDLQGFMHLFHEGGNVWSEYHVFATAGGIVAGGGKKTLTAELDRIQLVPSGANTFDGGSMNVGYVL